MKLRTQILGYGLVGALSAVLVGGIGLMSTRSQSAALNQVANATAAVRASMDSDQMHDAMRGDVMAGMVAADVHDSKGIEAARQELTEHRKRFDESLAVLRSQALPAEIKAQLDATEPLLKAYGESAMLVADKAATDGAGARKQMPQFIASFKALEKQMAALGEAISKHAETLGVSAQATAQAAQRWIVLALVAGLALVAVGAIALAGRLSRSMQSAVDIAERIAQGDLRADIVPQGNEETVRLMGSLARMQDAFAQMVHGMRGNAQSVATASSQISAGNHDLSQRTEQQASALQRTASSMEELNATVRQNADNAEQAQRLARGASDVASQGGDVVGSVVQTMRGISDSSKKIVDIISVIDGIAFQTNILALNAAVESARAGEQGRGFAVVAAEVRSLAQRSAEAAKEIKGLIAASVERVDQGTQLVDRAGSTMREIVESIGRVTSIMDEISVASREQSSGVTQVGDAVVQMDQATQQNAALVEESAAAAESLKAQAVQLVESIAQFKLKGDVGHAQHIAA